MISSRVSSPLYAVLAAGALSVAPIACKDKEKTEGKASGDKEVAKAEGKEGDKADGAGNKGNGDNGDNGNGGQAGDGGGIADVARNAVGIVSGPRDIAPHYAKELDPLLNLIPADADTFIVIRDVGAFVGGTLGYLEASKTGLEQFAAQIEKDDPADAAEMRDSLKKVVEFEKALTASGIDMKAGAVIAGKAAVKDDAVVLYGSATADALPTLLTSVGATENVPKNCTLVASAAGYSVCTEADPKAYAPGSKAADFRKLIESELPGVDLERANIIAHFTTEDGKRVPIVIETGQGMAHLSFAVPQAREDLARYLQPAKGVGLGLIGPGQPFLWGHGATKEIEAAGKLAPPMAQNVIKTVTGEVLAGGIDGAQGFAMLLGLSDPAPAAGLVALAGMGLGEVPKELSDGTKIDATVKTVRGAQAVHVKFEGGKQEKVFKDMGYVSEIFGFAAGQHAAITFGATEEVVETIANYKGTGPSKEMLEALPTPLAKALEAGEPAFAMYIPVDALQSKKSVDAFDSIVDALPPSSSGKDVREVLGLFTEMLAPMSSGSVWVSHLEEGPVFHVVAQGFAEVGTDEGDAALKAMSAVSGGADRKATYDALAAKYPSSPRVSSYKARAGELGDPFSSIFVVAGIGGAAGAAFFFRTDDDSSAPVEVLPPPTEPAVAPPPK